MIGDPEGDSFALLGRLVEKIRRTLSVKHISDDYRHGLQIADQMVRGRIEGDYSGKATTRQSLLSMAVKSLGMTSVAC